MPPLDLLLVSDLWPPWTIGGYEQGAHDVATRLARRGHRVTVLTSTYGVGAPCRDGDVFRVLHEEVYPRALRHRELVRETCRAVAALRRGRRVLRDARFDLVLLFNPLGLSAAFIEDLGRTGRPLVAYVSDDWVVRWPGTDALLARWTRAYPDSAVAWRALVTVSRPLLRALGAMPRAPGAVPVQHAVFVSRYIRDVSAPRMRLTSAAVVPWGIDVPRFPYRERTAAELDRWVFVGQLEEHKGAHVVVDAVRLLRDRGLGVTLTLHGRDTTAYAERLKARVARDGLGDAVRFAGPLPRERVAAEAYAPGGMLVFATVWPEPFSLTLVEAFASGLPVLTTVTGGTGELARAGENVTAWRAGDAADLAERFAALRACPDAALGMARRARAIVERHLDLDRMVERIEAHLLAVRHGGPVAPPAATHPWEGDEEVVSRPGS
jgi:glycogen(starch) synthase